MTYAKPQLVGYSALAAIQSSGTDKTDPELEPDQIHQSVPAYQADE